MLFDRVLKHYQRLKIETINIILIKSQTMITVTIRKRWLQLRKIALSILIHWIHTWISKLISKSRIHTCTYLFIHLRWTIKARVSNKSVIRNYSNARGPGKLFSCDLVDQSGEIRATAFNAECDKLHSMLEIGEVSA